MDFLNFNLLNEGVPTGGASGLVNYHQLGKVLFPNPAVRAYAYNAMGVPKMTNQDFTQAELKQAQDAYHNAQQGRQKDTIAVYPRNYQGNNIVTTSGFILKPIYNTVVNPMRMTTGSMWVTPEGEVVHKINGEFQKGDIYDFSERVQDSKKHSGAYKKLEDFGNKVRGDKPPMTIELNLKNQGVPTGGAAPIEQGVTVDRLMKAWNKRVQNPNLKNNGRRLIDINNAKLLDATTRDPISQSQVEAMVKSGMFGDYTKW